MLFAHLIWHWRIGSQRNFQELEAWELGWGRCP